MEPLVPYPANANQSTMSAKPFPTLACEHFQVAADTATCGICGPMKERK